MTTPPPQPVRAVCAAFLSFSPAWKSPLLYVLLLLLLLQGVLPWSRVVSGDMVDSSQQFLAAANLEIVAALTLQEVVVVVVGGGGGGGGGGGRGGGGRGRGREGKGGTGEGTG